MTEEKLKQIAFAVGWVEGRLEEDLATIQSADPQDPEEIKHRQEMLDAFLIVSKGLSDLRRENSDLALRMAQAGSFLNQ